MKKTPILLAEDDVDFGSILKQYLEAHHYKVTWAKNGKEALEIFKQSQKNPFAMGVLDVMMPQLDGFQLAEKIIDIAPEMPFIFLTARKLKEDKIKGLKLGADDYIIKPFDADILVLRLNNILRRTQNRARIKKPSKIQMASYSLDTKNYCLLRNGKLQKITEKEAELLRYLFHHKNQLLKREQILNAIWENDDFFSGRSMDVFISRIRKHLKADPSICIESTRGIGLTLHIDEEKKNN
ncbi:DNA-binding response OmpR family regulator [Gillisia sp. Hel_I_86]|uniref:response regulator transcription factor n=1 Tax=Gillisia sp. Hel_I_86 TaxID=1249981 RepID=UPI00119BEFE8|nr:response regulator transcription factor [Gillisia sp. Hel_I_86]TVZ25827.1 DNA-binding response OmpR family regulator [Gillisia sp. Hel_I_86]